MSTGCGAKYKAWKEVNSKRATSWEEVQKAKYNAVKDRKSTVTVTPVDPKEPANAKVEVTIFHSENTGDGAMGAALPGPVEAPKDFFDRVADGASGFLDKLVGAAKDVALGKVAADTVQEAFKQAGDNSTTTISSSGNQSTQGDLSPNGGDAAGPRDITEVAE